MTGNGVIDLVVNSREDVLRWYENVDGDLLFPQDLPFPKSERCSLIVADLTNDDLPDIITLENCDFGNAATVTWSINSGNGVFGAPQTAPSEPNCANGGIVVLDVDDDDLLDLVLGCGDGLRWYRNSGGGTFAPALLLSSDDYANELFAVDITNDGFTDILSVSFFGSVFWIENLKNESFGLPQPIPKPSGQDFVQTFLFDMTDNGFTDLAFSRDDQSVVWLENLQNGTFGPPQLLPFRLGESFFIGDLTNDSLPDLLVPSGEEVVFFENLGNAQFGDPQTVVIALPSQYLFEVKVGDLTGNGIVDFLVYYGADDGDGTLLVRQFPRMCSVAF